MGVAVLWVAETRRLELAVDEGKPAKARSRRFSRNVVKKTRQTTLKAASRRSEWANVPRASIVSLKGHLFLAAR